MKVIPFEETELGKSLLEIETQSRYINLMILDLKCHDKYSQDRYLGEILASSEILLEEANNLREKVGMSESSCIRNMIEINMEIQHETIKRLTSVGDELIRQIENKVSGEIEELRNKMDLLISLY
jgi:hypothetical protein